MIHSKMRPINEEIEEFKTAKIHMEKFLKANYEGIDME